MLGIAAFGFSSGTLGTGGASVSDRRLALFDILRGRPGLEADLDSSESSTFLIASSSCSKEGD